MILIRRRYNVLELPEIYLTSDGFKFVSNNRHRLCLMGARCVFDSKKVYIYLRGKMFVLDNVGLCFVKADYLYFRGLGEVKLNCDVPFKSYLSLDVESSVLDLNMYKRMAIRELFVNLLDMGKCENLKKFLKLIKNTLKINVFNEKIIIFQNNLRISYVLTYKIKNKIKKIYVN